MKRTRNVRRETPAIVLFLAALLGCCLVTVFDAATARAQGDNIILADDLVIIPDRPEAASQPHPAIAPEEHEKILLRKQEREESMAIEAQRRADRYRRFKRKRRPPR